LPYAAADWRGASMQLGLDRADYGTHTPRHTKATLIYRRTKNLRAVQLLLGHSKLESTAHYFGIEVNDALGADGGVAPRAGQRTGR
jgi:integrase